MIKKKIFTGIAVVIGLLIAAFIIFEVFLTYKMITFKNISQLKDVDYEIILGAGLDGDKPSPILQERLDEGLAYLNLHPDTKVIVSGGQGSNELIPEAEAMKDFLVSKGINPNRIIEEDKSKSTFQNLEFSDKILDERNAGKDEVLIVTSDFHLFRAMEIADYLGIKNEGLPSKTPIVLRVQYMIREFPAMIKLLLQETFLDAKDIV
ncbi:YdcF family protein [Clostridium sp. LIBA-8841]|uniref:YdcF family protein n=1 Tax=Clostridium sp. LIBA-8841 TaxID=2987530 RepID=UPI002AC4FD7F|nr:YdcF family protein [Clostridium sp. LIBA-8841]MDZ5253968.1 YdcF family protein [Clostridium sp. LIBA-8841]